MYIPTIVIIILAIAIQGALDRRDAKIFDLENPIDDSNDDQYIKDTYAY